MVEVQKCFFNYDFLMLAWYFRIRCNILMIIQGKKIDQPSGWCTRDGWNLLTKMDLIGNSAEFVKFLSSNGVLYSLWGVLAQKMNNSMIYNCHVMGITCKSWNVSFSFSTHITESSKHWICLWCICCKKLVPHIEIKMKRPWHFSFAHHNKASSFQFPC